MICEIFSICFHMLFGVFAFVLSRRFGLQAEKKRKRARRCPSPKYFKARLSVKSMLESKENGETNMNGILVLLSETITHGLNHGEDKTQEREKELKKKIKSCLEEIGEDSKILTAAFLYEVSSYLIKAPHDIIGRRRLALLKKVLQTADKEPVPNVLEKNWFVRVKENCCCGCCIPFMLIMKKCPNVLEKIKRVKGSKVGIILMLIMVFIFYSYDYQTDFSMVGLYSCRLFNLIFPNNEYCPIFSTSLPCLLLPGISYCQSDTNQTITNHTFTLPDNWMYISMNETDTYDESLLVFERAIAFNFMFSAAAMALVLCGSILAAIPTLRSLGCRYRVEHGMKQPSTEAGEVTFSKKDILHRFDLTFSESSVEGVMQLLIQLSVYLSNAWLLTWLEKKVTHSEEPSNPLQFSAILPSLTMSLLSQTLAQFKRRQLLFEYSDSSTQKILYLISSFLNSTLTSLLLVSVSTAFFDFGSTFQMMIMFGNSDGTNTADLVINIVWNTMFYGFMLVLALLSNPGLRLATSSPPITSTHSAQYYAGLQRQCRGIGFVSLATALVNICNILFSGGTSGKLSSWAEKMAGYSGQQSGVMSAVWPSEATENNNRKVFALFSAIGILASWMGAGLIENLYLERDTLEMEWVEEKEVEEEKVEEERMEEERIEEKKQSRLQMFLNRLRQTKCCKKDVPNEDMEMEEHKSGDDDNEVKSFVEKETEEQKSESNEKVMGHWIDLNTGFVSDEMTKLKEAGEADEGKAVVDASEIVEVREDANEDQVKLVQMSFGFWNPGK